MDKLLKNDIKVAATLTLVVGLISLVINPTLTYGLWLGFGVALINLMLTNRYIDDLFFKEKFTILSFALYLLSNYGLYILAFVIAVNLTAWFNIYMVAVGLVVIKCSIYIRHFMLFKKGAKSHE